MKRTGIGGYFELETKRSGSVYHDSALALNTGRNSFEYILQSLEVRRILLPFYICDVILQPLNKIHIAYEFYHVDEKLEPLLPRLPASDEYLFYINYFGIKDRFVAYLADRFTRLIIDNSQAFYSKPEPGVCTFYSPRKFFGLPDGGFAYLGNAKRRPKVCGEDKSIKRFAHLIERIENGPEEGYETFKRNDRMLDGLPIRYMSKLTRRLLGNIDFKTVNRQRLKNYRYLHRKLKKGNRLLLPGLYSKTCCPLVYPYLASKKGMREYLIRKKIYTALYWPNVSAFIKGKECCERVFLDNLVLLPIDQRYGASEMKIISELVIKYDK